MKLCLSCGHKYNSDDWKCSICDYEPVMIENFDSFSAGLAHLNESFDPEAFNMLAKVEEKNFWFRSRNRLLLWALAKYFPKANNMLEIGCGTGYVISEIEKKFRTLSVTGSDIYINGLKHAAKRLKRAKLFQMDCCQIPYVDEFDIIGVFDVIEHIRQDEKALMQIYKAVKPGGGIVLTVPQHMFLWSKSDEYSCHYRRYSSDDLKEKIERAGFKVMRITSFVTLLFPVMMITRLISRFNTNYNPVEELKINKTINSMFEKILACEHKLIDIGVNMPFGGSILLIAKKLKEN